MKESQSTLTQKLFGRMLVAGCCVAMLTAAMGQNGTYTYQDLTDTRVDVATDGAGTAIVTWLGNSGRPGGADRVRGRIRKILFLTQGPLVHKAHKIYMFPDPLTGALIGQNLR